MVNVGDRVRVVGYNGLYKSYDSYGTTGIVTRIHDNGNMDMKTDKGFIRCGHMEDFSIIPPEPPEKITQNGYEYSLVGPVKPEWLVDGAWVVRKESGEIGRVRVGIHGETVFSPLNEAFRDNVSNILVVEHYRPFTNSDWKWGMWAEYRGEKVFVCSGKLPFGLIRIAASPDGKIYPTLGSNGYVNISTLTPTTAP